MACTRSKWILCRFQVIAPNANSCVRSGVTRSSNARASGTVLAACVVWIDIWGSSGSLDVGRDLARDRHAELVLKPGLHHHEVERPGFAVLDHDVLQLRADRDHV